MEQKQQDNVINRLQVPKTNPKQLKNNYLVVPLKDQWSMWIQKPE